MVSSIGAEKVSESPFVSKYQAFLDSSYKKEIERLAEHYPQKRSLNVNFQDLEKFDYELADSLLRDPDTHLEALQESVERINIPLLDEQDFKPHVRFFNLPADACPLIRNLGVDSLRKMVQIDGVIKQITDIMPKIKNSTWECLACGNTYKIAQKEHAINKPHMCECKSREFKLIVEDSDYIDYQKILVQEPLELLKGNEQPSTFEVHVYDDLVNMVTAGDRIKITGILRLRPSKKNKLVFERFLESNFLEKTEEKFEELEILPEEKEKIEELSKDPLIYDKLIQSLAPTIYGHDDVKEAIIMQLFGGVKKVLPDDQKIRGNVHVLLVGDPGAAKSMMLMAVDRVAPKSVYTSGKTTTGAGISATAVKDEFGEGGWTLKAGALVLASGGLALIDEFDKMDTQDRSALHESLEQQTISVAKAGIVTRFKTETSVLAAANPKNARFDPMDDLINQIDLPVTLMSRFDLFFIIRDELDRTKDKNIAEHILKNHKSGENFAQSKKTGKSLTKEEQETLESLLPPIEPELLKKYISYARQNVFPVLSKEAIKAISDFYIELRDRGREEGQYAATHRQLEGLIRLSEASARVRLADEVKKSDAERAIRLLKDSLEKAFTDRETDRLDIDILTTGKSHSKRQTMKEIMKIVRDITKEEDTAVIEKVVSEADKLGIDEDRARDAINDLLKQGDLYKPPEGQGRAVKPVD